jgi:uncharacterized protein (TIGR00730 family)
VCVYCGSSNSADEHYKQLARDLGKALAERGMQIVYGGGHVGLMGLLADSGLQAGAKVTGIIPEHIRAHEVQHTKLSELFVVDSMHERKSLMAEKADAFVVLPGGFGTLDETFEILTWKQLALHNKPVVIFNINNFWNKFAPDYNHQLYSIVTNIDDMFTALARPAEKPHTPEEKWK